MTHSLTLGSLLLTDSLPDTTHDFKFDVLADGVGFGVAAGVKEVVTSLLSDGDLIRTTRYGNREVSFVVEITGPDLGSLAHGETALRREIGRGNTLTWQPPDDFALPTVFEVVASEMAQKFDDLDELNKRRKYTLTLTCAPWARSVNSVTKGALVAGTTTTLIDNCNTEGPAWTAKRNGVADVATTFWEAGAIGVAELDDAVTSPETWELFRTGSVNFTTTPYLVVEVRTVASDVGAPLNLEVTADGVVLPTLLIAKPPGSGYVATFDASGVGTVTTLGFKHVSSAGHPWQGLLIRNLSRTDIPPGVTKRQLTRIISPTGTERTPASIHVESANGTDDLGMTIVHTCPEDGSGYSPPLRRWRTAGNTVTTEATRFSGAYEDLEPNVWVAQVPQSALPAGGYLLVARLWSSPAATVRVSWSAGTIVNSVPQDQVIGETVVGFPVAGAWQTVPLAVLSLPTVRSLGPVTQINIQTSGADSTTTKIDEAWLFRMDDDCALTIVQNGTANLWLDSPDVNSAVPRVWVGDIGDRSDARHPGTSLVAMGSHVLSPQGTALFTAAETDYPKASVQFYPRWHSNAAE